MKVYTLHSLEHYLITLLDRLHRSGRATQNDIDMTEYNLNVIRDRIRDKQERENKP
jgi:hypothetical protein